jgi:type VI secretion system protein ImpL
MKLLRLIFNRTVFAVLGLIALGLVVWFLGPLVAIATWRPLEPAWVRGMVIGVIAAFYVGRRVWRYVAAKRANAQLATALVQSPAPSAAPEPGSEEVAELRRRFEEAIAVLKSTKERMSGRMSTLFGRQFLYELPWYMFIGAPGSGKTTALVHSGLHFPLAERFGHEIAGIGGTRNCDWHFTDQAVLIDTAGRYTTQESDREADHGAWIGFLKLLAKHRPRRPINGAIVTVSVADLLQQSPSQLNAQAQAIRSRLKELHEQLNVRFPVYVLVSKADLLPGFTEFFAGYGRDAREQVWGMTFQLAESGGRDVLADFNERFKALENRVNERLIGHLEEERDNQTRSAIYAFPQHFSTLKEPLQAFLRNVFGPSRFEEQPLVRGVYFASGTQEGSPIDRIVGGLARAFRLERKVISPQHATGRSFFITRLFTDVIFPEAGIAGTNLRWERQRLAIQWGGFAVAALATIGLTTAWSISYARNESYLQEVRTKLDGIIASVEALRRSPPQEQLVELLPILRVVQTLAISETVANGVPVSMQWGLYQGDKLHDAATQAYRKLLRDVFLPRIAYRIEDQLRSRQGNLELLYEALKAYIMLTDHTRFDPKAVKAFIVAEWESNLPREVTLEQRKALEAHLDALLALPDFSMPITADNELVRSTRATISRIPTAQRVYSRIKLQNASELPEFTIARAGGPYALNVFTRATRSPMQGVPGLFSYDGYHKVFKKAADLVSVQFAREEPWVLGVQRTPASRVEDPLGTERLENAVRQLYFEEYVRVWDQFVKDIRLVPIRNLDQSIFLSNKLSSPDSPMRALLEAIVRETTLIDDKADKSAVAKAAGFLSEQKSEIGKYFGATGGAARAARPESIVDDHFSRLRQYVRGAPGQPPPIEGTAALMKDMNTYLVAVKAAREARQPPPPSDVPNKLKAEAPRLPEPLQSAVGTLAGTTSREVAQDLRQKVNEALAQLIGFCTKAVEGRYPFVRTGKLDVTREDFTRLFGPAGMFDDFVQKQLTLLVDTTTEPWKPRDPAVSPRGSLLQFQRAKTIRDVFFHAGATPALKLEFKPIALDASITQLIIDFDGQVLRYSHGPQIPMLVQWPGTKTTSQIRIEVSPPSASGSASGQVFEGAWALLRMLDRAQLQLTNQPDKVLATWNIDGRKVQFEISSASVQNPMRLTDLQQFHCPAAL